jgi:hypothetical protein
MLLFWFQFVIPIQKNERNVVFYWTFCYFIFNAGKSKQGRATIAIYFQTFGIRISKFQKMLNKILEVAIDVHYKSVK